ncbi:glucose-1-phosphate thymidylyltransferase [Halobacteriales archaeon QH_2_65_14]|nr:MAG: glucose-1-phosphate thymidylyltransferase [Halobacteriales archaeon QH_2_65_14]
MKAVVLAGGYATRLWPVTRNRPKMLLPVGEQTVIDRILAELERDDRIDDVFVSTNERFADDFEAHIANSAFTKPQLSVEETVEENQKLGVIGALAQLVDREGIEGEDVLVVAGDNLISFDIADFLDFFEREGSTTLAAYDVESRKKARQYGLVQLEGTEVINFQEKPDEPRSTLVSIACYAFPADDVRFAEYLDGGNNPDEPGWFIQWLQDRQPVHAFTFEEAWFDIGTPESYLEAVSWALDGDTVVADSATVEDSTLGENVHVMGDATVTDSNVDRSIIFPEATVEDADVRDSIVDCEALVRDLDLSGALVGAHSYLP